MAGDRRKRGPERIPELNDPVPQRLAGVDDRELQETNAGANGRRYAYRVRRAIHRW